MSIAENIATVCERVDECARRAGRHSGDVALMAVSKTHPPERIREAYASRVRLYGENRVQEFASKAGALAELAEAEWHMIGHLQTNKAARAAELFDAVDSVDSVKLPGKMNEAGGEAEKRGSRVGAGEV